MDGLISEKKDALARLVALYEQNLEQFQQWTYNETQIRVDFLNPFIQLLDWDVMNESGLPQHLREVTHEATVIVEEDGEQRSKKPDYAFRIGTETLFYLETKKPAVNICEDRSPAFQVRRYGWSGNLKISLLSNFTDLLIYDCSVRPVEGDGVGTALVAHYHFTEYVECFDEIYGFLSKEAVLSGAFAEKFENIESSLRREPFDVYFLKQIQSWRDCIGKDVLANNRGVDSETLNIFVQRILDRIVFLRICEDRNLERYESLKGVTAYEELKGLFIAADHKYDSGLFEILDEDRLIVSDNIIIRIFQDLYYPNSSYDFSVIDPYIIGQIYELFLAENLEIQTDGNMNVVTKPEVVEAQGVVNTPKNITDIIVEETLNPLFNDKTPEEVQNYKIADICCGSGNFLLSTFEYIVNFYIDFFQKTGCEDALRRGDIYRSAGSSNLALSYNLRRDILKNMIYGVDIDPLAIEVTKFNLLLNVMAGVSEDELDAYHERTHERILPTLDYNIMVGNSLIDDSFADYEPQIYNDTRLMNKIKIFDWSSEFEGCKFDAIVGNPPYIRVQHMVHYSPEEYAYYKSIYSPYQTANADTLDKYYLFIERALALLNDGGMMGYIVPHKFMNIGAGAELRDLLSTASHVKKIYHFGTLQIFKNRSNYTCILILSKDGQDTFEFGYVENLNQFGFEHDWLCQSYPSDYLTKQPWTFMSQNMTEMLENISVKSIPLDSIADIFVGVQTSADDIYIVHADREDEFFIYGIGRDGIEYQIEKAILRKSVYDTQLNCYEPIKANSYIVFSYHSVNGRPVLYSIDEMRSSFPFALNYLQSHRDRLDRRKMPKRGEDNWYAFGRSQSLKRFISGEHLVWPVLSLNANYVYDDEMVVFTGGGNGPFYGLEMKTGSNFSILYVQAILNHWLMETYVKSKSSIFRGGYYSHGKQFVAKLPIYNVDFNNPVEEEKYNKIIDSVRLLMQLKGQVVSAPNSSQRTVLERAVEDTNRQLNTLINQLYGVTQPED